MGRASTETKASRRPSSSRRGGGNVAAKVKAGSKNSKAKSKRDKANKNRNGSKYLEDMLEIYTRPELRDEEKEEDDDSDRDGEAGDITGENLEGKDEITLCAKSGCKRKRGGRAGACVRDFCFLCCHEARNTNSAYCPGHYRMSQQKDTEDRYVAEGLNHKKGDKNKTKFYHYEEKFTNYNQTVTIWCARDFLANKEFSGDVMADVNREKRIRLMQQRRGLGAASQTSSSCGSDAGSRASSPRSVVSSSREKRHVDVDLDLSDSTVVKGWQALRQLHVQESKERFDQVLASFRSKAGKNMDSTAFLLS